MTKFDGGLLDVWPTREFARRLTYLPQQIPAAPAMTVRELAAMSRCSWHGALGRFGPDDRESVERALERSNMLPLADRLVDTLSGGERQCAWLAMLLAQYAACLLLDEPTAALDVAHQIEVLSLVRTLSRASGLTVILVLHDINMASRFCDQIVALHSGRLVASGQPNQIMEKTTLERIYGVQMDILPNPRPIASSPSPVMKGHAGPVADLEAGRPHLSRLDCRLGNLRVRLGVLGQHDRIPAHALGFVKRVVCLLQQPLERGIRGDRRRCPEARGHAAIGQSAMR